ncbi:hypothetical protein [Streptomyces sp. CL12]
MGHRYAGDPADLPDWWGSWRDLVNTAFETVWARGVPHEDYKLT